MKLKRFEDLCRQAGCKPVKKVVLGECEAYIADGYRDRHPHFEYPAYRTIWAVSRNGDGEMDVMRDLYIKVGAGSLQARINAAMVDLKHWVDANVEVGRYAE